MRTLGRSHPEGRKRSRLHHDLDAAVLLVAEGLVEFGPFFERCPMGDDKGRVDLALLDAFQHRAKIAATMDCLTQRSRNSPRRRSAGWSRSNGSPSRF